MVKLSIITGRPVEEVVTVYKTYRHKGWGQYAKHLGIKPGSREFHQLKDGGVVVLERWRGADKKVIYIDKQDSDHHDYDRRDEQHEYENDHGNGHDNDNGYEDNHGKGLDNGKGKGHGKK